MDDIQEIAEVCERAARAGGAVLLDWSQRFTVREKGPADLVTEADLAAENVVRQTIANTFPHHQFIGEESTPTEQVEGILNDPSSCVWVVDPLDGTTNYAHHIPHYACSVAAVRGGQILAGVVFHPVAEECYIAIRGKGATLNGDRLRTSSVSELGSALVAVSIPPQIQRDAAEVKKLLLILEYAQSIRRTGSAALNMCYVASGRLDAYWAINTSVWDIAAGALLVSEAGGMICDPSGGPFDLSRPHPLATANPALKRALVGILQA